MGAGALHASVGQTISMFVGVGSFESSNFHVVDHPMSHRDRGAMGQLVIDGAPNPAIFNGDATANTLESK